MTTLVSHTQNSRLLNKALYCHFGDELYLCNDFTPSCKTLQLLEASSRRVSTEPPLYGLSSSQRLNYIESAGVTITESDLELCASLMPSCIIQASRLKLISQRPGHISALVLELVAFWKTFLIRNRISHYLCWSLPHQLSDLILFETANQYCLYTETTYCSSMGVTLRMTGSYIKNSMKVINKKTTSDMTKAATDIIEEYLTRLTTFPCTQESSNKDHENWLMDTLCTDATKGLGPLTIRSYIDNILSPPSKQAYLDSLNLAISASESCLPADGSVVVLLNVEPEATICPMASPFITTQFFISYVRAIVPAEVPIYLKEHPGAYDPSHRMYVSGEEVIGCVAHRDSKFFSLLSDNKNIKYLAPWLCSPDWMYSYNIYYITLGSTAIFELGSLGAHVAVVGTSMSAIAKRWPSIHILSRDSVNDFLLNRRIHICIDNMYLGNKSPVAIQLKRSSELYKLPWTKGYLPIELLPDSRLPNLMKNLRDYELSLPR